MTHICVCKVIIIGSDNDLVHGQCQAIVLTNWTLKKNLDQNTYIFMKMHLKMAFENDGHFVTGFNVLIKQVIQAPFPFFYGTRA